MQMHNDVIDFSIVYENLLYPYSSRRIEFLFNFRSNRVYFCSILNQFCSILNQNWLKSVLC